MRKKYVPLFSCSSSTVWIGSYLIHCGMLSLYIFEYYFIFCISFVDFIYLWHCWSRMYYETTLSFRNVSLYNYNTIQRTKSNGKMGFPCLCSYPPKVVYCFYTSEFLNPVSRTSFIGMTWNIFCERFRPPEIQIYKKMFVILWFCHFVIGNTYLITRFLYLNIIQSSPNLAQLFI